ncbi:MAG: hypothetical protein GXZ05_05180 [Gammaproteobacteria bacterium]|nr:hypothetical protein [Gammaproteobacteria bacterium]
MEADSSTASVRGESTGRKWQKQKRRPEPPSSTVVLSSFVIVIVIVVAGRFCFCLLPVWSRHCKYQRIALKADAVSL